ncbi:MAG: YibE/F family protein, partial [Patescibacteria group bacterium]
GVVATFISLVITGLLAVYFVDVTHLTGFASEEAGFLQVERQGSIDIRGLLLAGIIISTLGILDDVTIGQASVVKQLKKANPKISFLELFKNGMKVGQDHISSMVNTLVLVYSGSALPLLLLFFDSQKTFVDILEFELIAEEIVRMLVGSIGLVLAAPLATIMAAYIFSKGKNDN